MKAALKYFFIWLLLTVIGGVLFFVISTIVCGIVGYEISDPSDLISNPWVLSSVMLGIDLLILLVFWQRKYTRFGFSYGFTYGERFSTKKLCLWAIVGAIGCLLLDVLVQEYVPIPVDPDIEKFLGPLMGNPLGLLTVCLIGPLPEEAIFRGAIERRLLEKHWNHWYAIVISAIFFAVAHFNYAQGATAIVIGCFMGWIYYRTRSIWPGFLIHAFNNTAACVAAYSYPDSMTSEDLGVPLSQGIPLIVLSLILIAIAAHFIGKMTDERIPIPVPTNEVLPPPLPAGYALPDQNVEVGTPIEGAVLGNPLPEADEALPTEASDNTLPPED